MFNEKICTNKRRTYTGVSYRFVLTFIILGLYLLLPQASAQQSQDEHESHHPELQSASQQGQINPTISGILNPTDPAGIAGKRMGPGGPPAGGMGPGGMGPGVMNKMMEKMGAPKPKDLYPSLMALPDLPQEQRGKLKQAAHQRMLQGTSTMSDGFSKLSNASAREDYAGMQNAIEEVKKGIGEYNSGLATHRALEEGKAPKNVALQWFKSQMNLLPVSMQKRSVTFFGMSPFHSSVMLVLILFALAMFWMYFFKLRRASALLAELVIDRSIPSSPASKEPVAAPLTQPTSATAETLSETLTPTSPVIPSAGLADKWSGELEVIGQFQETHDVRTFRLADPGGAALPFAYEPGQFLTFSLQPEDKIVKRSYTIASSPAQREYIEVTIKREEHGLISRYLHDRVNSGDRLQLQAPAGKFSFNGKEADNIVLISGGVGVTPMMSATRYLTAHCWPGNIYFLFCGRTTNDFIFRQELEYLQQRHTNLHVLASMTRAEGTAWMGPQGRFTAEMINDFVPDIVRHRAHICGPPAMMDAVKDMLLGLGVAEVQIKTEAFGTVKRAPTTQAKTSPVSSDQPVLRVRFSLSQKTVDLSPGMTILDAAEDSGIDIDNSCRSGTCGSCRIKLLSGEVSMDVEEALEPNEKAEGYILACQAIASKDIVVEA